MPAPHITGKPLQPEAEAVLKEILTACGLDSVLITSVGRTVAEQARVMYENCEQYGAPAQHALYRPPGQKVVDVYSQFHATLSASAVQALMAEKILEVGSSNVSHHIADANHYVFDVGPSSIPQEKREAFIAAAASHPRVSKFLKPPADPAYHLEVTRQKSVLTS